MKVSQKTLDVVKAISEHYGTPLYCFYLNDNGKIVFRSLTRNDLLEVKESEFIQDSIGNVAMFETKQEALEYLRDNQPVLLKLVEVKAEDLVEE